MTPRVSAYRAASVGVPTGNSVLNMTVAINNAMVTIIGVVQLLILVYPIIVLYIMMKATTVAAFRGEYVDPHAHQAQPVLDDFDQPFRPAEPDNRYRPDEQ